MDMFGFFYRCSAGLGNLLDRAELFAVSPDIKDQLILALADLVTLVVCVAKYFHRSLLASDSVSIDIYSTFPGPIDSFRGRCEQVSDLMWRYQLTREGLLSDNGNVIVEGFPAPKPICSGLMIVTQPSGSIPSRTGCSRKTQCSPTSPKPRPP